MLSSTDIPELTFALTENFENELKKYSSVPKDEKHAFFAICIGYKESLALRKILLTLTALMQHVHHITLLLAPKDEQAYTEFKQNNAGLFDFIEQHNNVIKIITEEELRKTPAWLDGEKDYHSFMEKEKYSASITETLKADILNYSQFGSAETVRKHVLDCVKDMVCFAKDKSSVKFLIYANSPTQTLHHAMMNLHNILNVNPENLHFYRIKPNFKPVEKKLVERENKETAIHEKLKLNHEKNKETLPNEKPKLNLEEREVLDQLIRSCTDGVWAGNFFGGFLKSYRNDSEPTLTKTNQAENSSKFNSQPNSRPTLFSNQQPVNQRLDDQQSNTRELRNKKGGIKVS